MNDWISVKDKLPEPGYVIVYAPEYCDIPMIVDYRLTEDNELVFWDFEDWNDQEITEEVTHWMPLPEPPKP